MVCEVSICETGLLERVDTYRPGDVLQYYDTYEYDDQGNRIGEYAHNADGSLKSYSIKGYEAVPSKKEFHYFPD